MDFCEPVIADADLRKSVILRRHICGVSSRCSGLERPDSGQRFEVDIDWSSWYEVPKGFPEMMVLEEKNMWVPSPANVASSRQISPKVRKPRVRQSRKRRRPAVVESWLRRFVNFIRSGFQSRHAKRGIDMISCNWMTKLLASGQENRYYNVQPQRNGRSRQQGRLSRKPAVNVNQGDEQCLKTIRRITPMSTMMYKVSQSSRISYHRHIQRTESNPQKLAEAGRKTAGAGGLHQKTIPNSRPERECLQNPNSNRTISTRLSSNGVEVQDCNRSCGMFMRLPPTRFQREFAIKQARQ